MARAGGESSGVWLVAALMVACGDEGPRIANEGPDVFDESPPSGTVDTREGRVRGVLRSDADVWEYRGIPYAAAPTGERRFRPPQPPSPRDGELAADAYGPVCPQLASAADAVCLEGSGGSDVIGDEDCLRLNVLAPRAPSTTRRPVLVNLHGGGFTAGCGRFASASLAERIGAVVVSLDYRLGLLGSLTSDAILAAAAGDGPSANWGILDMLAALEWVRDNIGSFGGDRNNVTVLGQSAGAVAACALAASPRADGLFRRLAMQSGHCEFTHGLGAQLELGASVQDVLGCAGDGALACLQGYSPADLVQAMPDLTAVGLNVAETVTVDDYLLEERPLTAIRERAPSARAILVGSTRDEIPLTDPGLIASIEGDYAGALRAAIETSTDLGAVADEVLALYPDPGEGRVARYATFSNEVIFNCPALEAARTFDAVGARAYLYQFNQGLSSAPPDLAALGAYHSLDAAYLFDDFASLEARGFTPAESDRELAERMQQAWGGFARSSEPVSDPAWPSWQAGTRRYFEWSAAASSVREDYHEDRCDALAALRAMLDRDGDGVADADDNCPDVANVNQHDTDGDGTGDRCS